MYTCDVSCKEYKVIYSDGDTDTVSEDHTFTAVWESIATTETDKKSNNKSNNVETGDDTNVFIPLVTMCSALAGIFALMIMRRRQDM